MTTEQLNESIVFSVDLGGTHLRAALIDRTGRILLRLKQETPREATSAEIVETIARTAESLNSGGVVAAAIVVPGTVDVGNSLVVQVPNLPGLKNQPLKTQLEDRLSCAVVLENDANAAAVGEQWMGAARGYNDIVCVTLGTGVGGGMILNGKLWRGAHGSSGEIGHAAIDPFSGLKCKCGGVGCLELFASATAIVRMTIEQIGKHPDSLLTQCEVTAARVYEAGLQGDELALKVFASVGNYLGAALANLINLVDPEIIVIAGGVINGWKLFETNIREQIALRAVNVTGSLVRVEPAQCGDDAGLLGAARLAFDHLGGGNLLPHSKAFPIL